MSEPEEHQLTTPESVAADADAIEIMRMWWSNGEPVMSVKPAFNDPQKFGQMLAIAAKHMAHGYAVRHGHDERQIDRTRGRNDRDRIETTRAHGQIGGERVHSHPWAIEGSFLRCRRLMERPR